jgi:hypothetical protein
MDVREQLVVLVQGGVHGDVGHGYGGKWHSGATCPFLLPRVAQMPLPWSYASRVMSYGSQVMSYPQFPRGYPHSIYTSTTRNI